MSLDLDPNFALPLWTSLVRYFRAYPPLVQSLQRPAANAPDYTPPTPGKPARVVRIAGLR